MERIKQLVTMFTMQFHIDYNKRPVQFQPQECLYDENTTQLITLQTSSSFTNVMKGTKLLMNEHVTNTSANQQIRSVLLNENTFMKHTKQGDTWSTIVLLSDDD